MESAAKNLGLDTSLHSFKKLASPVQQALAISQYNLHWASSARRLDPHHHSFHPSSGNCPLLYPSIISFNSDMALELEMVPAQDKCILCTRYIQCIPYWGKSTDNCMDSCKEADTSNSMDHIDKIDRNMDSRNTGKDTGTHKDRHMTWNTDIHNLDHLPRESLRLIGPEGVELILESSCLSLRLLLKSLILYKGGVHHPLDKSFRRKVPTLQ
jgi:hypothetical protein